ncbi:hypothetical protein ACFQ3B_01350 [Stackebrandtia endophytica]|nr:hypothetical protein [Stackebrandtia endophytica]
MDNIIPTPAFSCGEAAARRYAMLRPLLDRYVRVMLNLSVEFEAIEVVDDMARF